MTDHNTTHVVKPEYYEMSVDECDIWALQHVKSELLLNEAALFQTKWFDYRFIHPVHATMKYAEEYIKVYRRIYGENLNEYAAKNVKVFKDNFLNLDSTTITGLWKGRQIADAIGMPYKEFIEAAMRERIKYWKQRFLPRAHHIYSTQVIEKVVDYWDKLSSDKTYYSKLNQYLVQNFENTKCQNDHIEWLVKTAKSKTNPVYFLRQVYAENLLSDSVIENYFGNEILEEIIC